MPKALQKPLPGGLPPAPSPSSANSKLALKILLPAGVVLAGSSLEGTLEIAVSSTQLALGEVGIELSGYEELRSRDHTSTRRLLSSRIDFQGGTLPPSNAVVPNSAPVATGYYPALKGKTRFAFKFKLPSKAPSSCSLGSNATTRYELRAFASSMMGNTVDIKSEKKEVRVVERWADWEAGEWDEGVEQKAAEKLRLGGEGKLEVVARIGKGQCLTPSRLFWRGDSDLGVEGKGKVEVLVKVRNGSSKHVSGLKLSLCRRLRILQSKGSTPPIVTATVVSQPFHGSAFEFPPNSERDVVLEVQIPKDECWTVRRGTLFELDVFALVEVDRGILANDLALELPIWVPQPHSLPPSAHEHVAKQLRRSVSPSPFPAEPHQYHHQQQQLDSQGLVRSPSSMSFAPPPRSASAMSFAPPPQMHPAPGFADFGQGHHVHYAGSSVSMANDPRTAPNSKSTNASSAYSQPPQPYFAPPPPTPAFIQFDPNAPDLTQSRFLHSLETSQPGSVFVPPNSAMPFAMGMPSHVATPVQTLQPMHFAPPPSISPPLPQPPQQLHQLPQQQQLAEPTSPSRPRSSLGHRPTESCLEQDIGFDHATAVQVAANLAPIEPYSMTARVHQAEEQARHPHVEASSSPPAAWDQVAPSPSPSPVPMHRAPTINTTTRALRTPPPPSPSSGLSGFSAAVQPAIAPIEGFTGMGDGAGLLETIGEDGESQAGTARSVAAGIKEALAGPIEEETEVHSVQGRLSHSRSSAQDLEDLVAEEDRRLASQDKTLPAPPVPSVTSKPLSTLPRAQDIFSTPASPKVEKKQQQQPIGTVPPPLSKSPMRLARADGGLSALEARLSRPVTPETSTHVFPTLPLSPTPSSGPSRALSPPRSSSTNALGALRARSISRATSERELAQRLAAVEQDPSEALRKALASAPTFSTSRPASISMSSKASSQSYTSMGLTSSGAPSSPASSFEAELEKQFGQQPPKSPIVEQLEAMAIEEDDKRELKLEQRRSVPSTPSRPSFASKRKPAPSAEEPSTELKAIVKEQLATPRPAPISISSAPVTVASPSSPTRKPLPAPPSPLAVSPATSVPNLSPLVDGRKVVDAVEIKGLKKEAATRVTDWLKEEASPTSNRAGDKAARRHTATLVFGRPAPAPPSPSSTPTKSNPWSSNAVASSRPRHKYTKSESHVVVPPAPIVAKVVEEPTMAELLAATETASPRSSPTKTVGVLPALSRTRLGRLEIAEDAAAARYDVRSARGGKGGVVTNVANKWAARIEEAELDRVASPPLGSVGPKFHKTSLSVGSTSPAPAPLSPVDNTHRVSHRTSPHAAKRLSEQAPPAPAFINTTVGRPAVLSQAVRTQPSMMMRGSVSSPALGTAATKGGAKVADLLARYQQNVASQ